MRKPSLLPCRLLGLPQALILDCLPAVLLGYGRNVWQKWLVLLPIFDFYGVYCLISGLII